MIDKPYLSNHRPTRNATTTMDLHLVRACLNITGIRTSHANRNVFRTQIVTIPKRVFNTNASILAQLLELVELMPFVKFIVTSFLVLAKSDTLDNH